MFQGENTFLNHVPGGLGPGPLTVPLSETYTRRVFMLHMSGTKYQKTADLLRLSEIKTFLFLHFIKSNLGLLTHMLLSNPILMCILYCLVCFLCFM